MVDSNLLHHPDSPLVLPRADVHRRMGRLPEESDRPRKQVDRRRRDPRPPDGDGHLCAAHPLQVLALPAEIVAVGQIPFAGQLGVD